MNSYKTSSLNQDLDQKLIKSEKKFTKKLNLIILIVILGFLLFSYLNKKFINNLFQDSKVVKDQIEEAVKADLQKTFDEKLELKYFNLKVEDFKVLSTGKNTYKGIAKVKHDFIYYDVIVEITTDEDRLMWQIVPGSLPR